MQKSQIRFSVTWLSLLWSLAQEDNTLFSYWYQVSFAQMYNSVKCIYMDIPIYVFL